jgi:hypothetical protein
MRTEIKPRYSMELRVVKRSEQNSEKENHDRIHHDD